MSRGSMAYWVYFQLVLTILFPNRDGGPSIQGYLTPANPPPAVLRAHLKHETYQPDCRTIALRGQRKAGAPIKAPSQLRTLRVLQNRNTEKLSNPCKDSDLRGGTLTRKDIVSSTIQREPGKLQSTGTSHFSTNLDTLRE
jgi:hypothetical protein